MDLNQDQINNLSAELYGQPEETGPDYDKIVKDQVDVQKSQLQSSMFVASQRNPDEYGRFNKIAAKYNTTPGYVAENPQDFEQKEKMDGIDYDKLIKANPKLTEFLKDPDNATLAQDDLENLQGLTKSLDDHSIMSDVGNSFMSGLSRMNSSLAKVPAFMYDAAAIPQNLIVSAMGRDDLKVRSPEWLRKNAVTESFDAGADAYGDQVQEINQSALEEINGGNYSRAGKIIALQVVNNFPQQAANIGLSFMNPFAGPAMAFSTTAAAQNAENAEKGIDPLTSTLNATLHGTIEAGFESLGTFGILDKWSAKLTKTYGEATTREIVKETGKALAASFAGEANEEAMTSIAQGFADKHMGINPELTYGEIFKGGADAALVGAFSGLTTTGPAAIGDASLGIRARFQRTQDIAFYQQLGDFTEKSKLKERSPEKYKALVEQITEGTPVERVYMPVEGVEEYFQSKGINAVQFMNDAGLTKEYEAAKLTGGNIELPLATWVEKVGKTEHFRGLENNVKFNQDALTKNEEIREKGKLKRLFAEAEAEAQAKLADPEFKAQQEKIETELNQVRERITEQLKGTNKYTPELIKDQVELIVGPLRYFSAANNKSPLEYLNEVNLNIRNGGQYKTEVEIQDESVASDIDKALGFDPNEPLDAMPMQLEGIPAFDNDGNRIYDDSIVGHLRQSINNGEAGKRFAKTDENGEVVGSAGSSSTFPDFFQDKGYTKKETLTIIDKHLRGEKLTEKQQAIFDDLYDGALDKTNRREFFQFAGQQSKTAPIAKLQEANQQSLNGVDMEQIRKDTGWFKGPDNRWRYEISDEKASFKNIDINKKKKFKLNDVLEHPELFAAYPQLADINVQFSAHRGRKGGHFSMEDNTIKVMVKQTKDYPKKYVEAQDTILEIAKTEEYLKYAAARQVGDTTTVNAFMASELGTKLKDAAWTVRLTKPDTSYPRDLNVDTAAMGVILHEIQHAIQAAEGFARGTNKHAAAGYQNYFNTLGEVEARDAADRKTLKDSERSDKTPSIQTWKKPIINWGNVTAELPIESPEQMKKVVFGEQLKLFQSAQAKKVPPFYYKSVDIINNKMGNSASPEQILGMLKEVKPEEMKWLGIDDYLKGKKKVTKEELLAHLNGNAIEIQEVTLDNNTEGSFPKYQSYVLPGGDNYREVLFTLPVVPKEFDDADFTRWFNANHKAQIKSVNELTGLKASALARYNREGSNSYTSSHFDQKNILAHIRVNDRTDADGKRVLFVEEIQSDWHQDGRKKGYTDPVKTAAYQKAVDESAAFTETMINKYGPAWWGRQTPEETAEFDRLNNLALDAKVPRNNVPDAPLKKTWHEFVVRRLMRMAAEQGYERISWTTGEQQAERFDISKQLSEVKYKKNSDGTYNFQAYDLGGSNVYNNHKLPESELEGAVGKELTEKILNGEGEKWERGPIDGKTLKGLDLKVGGEGMKGFYDNIIVKYAEKFGKKFGAKVTRSEVDITDKAGRQLVYDENQNGSFSVFKEFESDNVIKTFKTAEEAQKFIDDNFNKKAEVHSLDITPELKQTALEKGFEFFQDEVDPRARVIFDKYGISVDLFKGSDPTSLMHEMGHVYLEMFKKTYQAEGAPEWLKADAQKVLKHLGIESFNDLKVEHHEFWARSVEKYLYEGKAPTDDLVGTYARLKMWFRKVYTDVKSALGVELNDEIREVMDRVFVGDHLLVQAEKQYAPLIPDAVIRSMPPEEQEKYRKLLDKYKAKATETVTDKLMEQHRRERRKWWKAETEKIQAIYREDLAKRREYIAQNYLKTGILPNQDPVLDERAHKLNRASIAKALGGVPKWVNKSILHAEGTDIKIMSDILGFASVEAFNEEMSKTEDIDVASKRMAEEYMKKEYGDVFADETQLKELVENAVHNDKKAQVLRKELEFLASEDLAALKGLIKRIARRPPKDEIIKARAEKIIAEKVIGDLQPFVYQRAEAKAAAEAADHFTRGDFEKAFDAKQRELLNFYLYKEAIRAKQLVEEKVQWTKKVFEGSAKDVAEKRDWSMVSLARVLLGEYGVTTRDIKSVQDYLEQLRQYDEDSYEALRPLVNKWLIDKKDYKKMSIQDFSEFMIDIEALWSLAKSSRELEVNGVKHDIEEISGKLSDRLKSITNKPYKPGETQAVTANERGIDRFMSFKSSMQRIESWVDIVDEGDETKVFETFFLNPVRDVITNYRLKKTELLEKYKTLVNKVPVETLAVTDIKASEINYTFKDKAELLAALLHVGNDSNLFKLLAGRKWGDVDQDTGTVDPARWNRFLDRMHRENVITKADWDFIQGVWDLNESIKPDAQKAHKDMFGHYFNEVTAKKFLTPFGEYKGGYMPAVTDSFLVEDSRIRQEQDALLNNNNSFMFPTTGRGFTKARVERYHAPLLLDMNMVANHFDKVLRFTYIEPTIKKVAKINNKKDYRAVLREYDPYAGSNLINPWLQRSAQQRVVQPSQTSTYRKFDGVAKFIRSSAGLQILGLNLANATQQLTGTIVASSKVHPKYLVKAIGNYAAEPIVTKNEIMEMSPWMKTRLGEGSMKLTDDINQVLFNPSKFEQVTDFAKKNGMVLSEMFQHVVDITVWQGAYAEALDQGMSKEQAIRRADKEVRLTQGSANSEDISSVEEGTHWSRLFTQFYGYFNMQANLIGSETAKKVKVSGWKGAIGKLLPFYITSYLLPGLAAQMIAKMMSGQKWDEDEDDSIIDDLAWMTLNSTYRGVFAMVPMVGQFANMMIGQFTNVKYDDKLSLSPAMQQLENIGRTAYVGFKAAEGEDLKGNEIKSMLSTLGFVTGLPIGPLGKPVGYLKDIADDRAEATGPIDFARGLSTGKDSQK